MIFFMFVSMIIGVVVFIVTMSILSLGPLFVLGKFIGCFLFSGTG